MQFHKSLKRGCLFFRIQPVCAVWWLSPGSSCPVPYTGVPRVPPAWIPPATCSAWTTATVEIGGSSCEQMFIGILYIRPLTVYFTVNESSDMQILCPTRKKTAFQLLFLFFPPTCHEKIQFNIIVFSNITNKEILIFYQTRQNYACRNLLTVKYTKCVVTQCKGLHVSTSMLGLSIIMHIFVRLI